MKSTERTVAVSQKALRDAIMAITNFFDGAVTALASFKCYDGITKTGYRPEAMINGLDNKAFDEKLTSVEFKNCLRGVIEIVTLLHRQVVRTTEVLLDRQAFIARVSSIVKNKIPKTKDTEWKTENLRRKLVKTVYCTATRLVSSSDKAPTDITDERSNNNACSEIS